MSTKETIVREELASKGSEVFTYATELSLYNWRLKIIDYIAAVITDEETKSSLSKLIVGIQSCTTGFAQKGTAKSSLLAQEKIQEALALLESSSIDGNRIEIEEIKDALQKFTDIVNQTDTFTVQAFSLINNIHYMYTPFSPDPTSKLFASDAHRAFFRIDKEIFLKMVTLAIGELEDFIAKGAFLPHPSAVSRREEVLQDLPMVKNDLSKLEAHYLIGKTR